MLSPEDANAISVLRGYLPHFFSNLIIATFIWLFGVLVFIPTADLIELSGRTVLLVTLITLIAFTIFVYKSLENASEVFNAFSTLFSHKIPNKELNKLEKRRLIKGIIQILFITFLTILYWPLLSAIHPALFGIFLIFAIIFIFVELLRITSDASKVIISWLRKP